MIPILCLFIQNHGCFHCFRYLQKSFRCFHFVLRTKLILRLTIESLIAKFLHLYHFLLVHDDSKIRLRILLLLLWMLIRLFRSLIVFFFIFIIWVISLLLLRLSLVNRNIINIWVCINRVFIIFTWAFFWWAEILFILLVFVNVGGWCWIIAFFIFFLLLQVFN